MTAGLVLTGSAGCGFDSSWALVWAGNALRGHAATRPPGVILPTPHPASLLWGMLARLGPANVSRTVWALSIELVLVMLLAGVFVLGARIGGRSAGCASVLVVASLPALGVAVSSGTVDVLFAAAVVWSVIFAAARPSWAMALAAVASLARPEGIVLVGMLAVYRWRGGGLRFRVSAVVTAVAVPGSWLLMGAALFADPLVALHVTVANTRTGHGRVGLGSLAHAVLLGGGWVGVVIAGCALVYAVLLRTKSPVTVFGTSCCVAMGIVLVMISADGAAIPARYFAAELACAVPLGMGAICAVQPKRAAPRYTALAAVAGLAIIGVVTSLGPRSLRVSEDATQGTEFAMLAHVLAADQRCAAISLAPHVFLPAVILDADRPVRVSPSEAGSAGADCRLSARDPLTAAGDGWGPEPSTLRIETVPPSADVIATTTSWVLYVY